MTGASGGLNLLSDALVFLVLVVAVALVGGLYPALFAAIATSLLPVAAPGPGGASVAR